MHRNTFITVISLVAAFALTPFVFAHEAGVTDTGITITRSGIKLVYTVPEAHVVEITGLDLNSKAAQQIILNGFNLFAESANCKAISSVTRSLQEIESQQFEYVLRCDEPVRQLNLQYELLFDQDTAHKNFVRIRILQYTKNIVLASNNRSHTIDVESLVRKLAEQKKSIQSEPVTSRSVLSGVHYFPVGVEHILLGFDHLLFLIALLLLPMRLRQMLIMVTAFTIAHSITLVLSVLDIISLRPAVTEFLIAVSIVYMAIESLYFLQKPTSRHSAPSVIRMRTGITAAFGLLHGFGFSYLLKTIGLGDQAASALLFFNLGVEAGQLLIIALCFPIAAVLFKRYASVLWAQLVAVGVGSMGLYWLIERM